MGVLTLLLNIISAINGLVLAIGRNIAWVALALMVVVILIQIFFRYALNSALPWPDEAARFLMLWMTGLIAPSGLRQGGFVAIDTLPRMMPPRLASLLMLIILVLAAVVLAVAISIGWKHTMGFGGNFDSSSLKIPLDWFGGESMRVKLRYMYGSLLVGVILMLAVSVELILRNLIMVLDPDQDLPDLSEQEMAGAD